MSSPGRLSSWSLPALLLLAPLALADAPARPPAGSGAIDPAQARTDPKDGTLWYDVRLLGVEGQGWSDVKAPFDRFPARAEGQVPAPVWNLSRQSAGLCVRFVTDAPTLKAHWILTSAGMAMPHMPATGVSGLDLYTRQPDGRWTWLAVAQPTAQDSTATLFTGLPAAPREYLLYLPLYNGVSAVEIGLPKGSSLRRAPDRPAGARPPIVFYGTSITQGGCASRPGMVHTALLGRHFDRPVINLGFSGNGRMDPGVVQLLAELDPAVYVIDCLPNMTAAEVAERTPPLVRTLRKAHPATAILLVEDRTYANAPVRPDLKKRNETSRAALRQAYEFLVKQGIDGLFYLPGDKLLGDDGEATVDGSHPTDLGFARQADAFRAALMPLLPRPITRADQRPVEGYTDRLSYLPGETVKLHVSTPAPRYSVRIARWGADRVEVFRKDDLPGREHPVPYNACARGCNWPVAFELKIPDSWRTGYYAGTLEAAGPDGKPARSDFFFVVRSPRPGQDTKILLQLSTNTYNAYTNWGGYSLYAYHAKDNIQGRRVSFDRPQYSQFPNWEQPFVAWAEKAGYPIDYAVNSDLEFHPELLQHYKLVLSVGHDEYWSSPMRDHLEKFIAAGGNVAFFSGNTCCWQVRSEDAGRALVCWKQAYKDDPVYLRGPHAFLSSLWSHHLVARPENKLTGVGFLWGGYHLSHGQFMDGTGAFTVHRPDHWLFAGASLKRGDAFGGKDTVVGYECDGCELTWKDGLPFPTHKDGTPDTFEVLATCKAKWHPDDSEWYERWEKGRVGNSVLGVYTRGGTVVTVGSTDWSHGLRGNDPAVVKITRNVLDRLGK